MAALRCWSLSWSGPVMWLQQGQTLCKGAVGTSHTLVYELALMPRAVTLRTPGSRGTCVCLAPFCAVGPVLECSSLRCAPAHKRAFFLLGVELFLDRAELSSFCGVGERSQTSSGGGVLRQPSSSRPWHPPRS